MKTTVAIINKNPHLINAFILVVLLTLVASYVYLLSLTVVHVVMRKEVSRDIAHLHSEISTLESQYMVAQHRVSTEIAKRTDLAVTSEKVFLHKDQTALVLTSRDN